MSNDGCCSRFFFPIRKFDLGRQSNCFLDNASSSIALYAVQPLHNQSFFACVIRSFAILQDS